MTSDPEQRRLSRLRRRLSRSLSTLSVEASLLTPQAPRRARASGPSTLPSGRSQMLHPRSATNASVPRAGSSPLDLDDEPGARALAKQIKQLIMEDIRRGIGFGG